MRPSLLITVLATLALCGCANGFTPEPGGGSSFGLSAPAGFTSTYNSDYQGGELSRSPLDHDSEMFQ